MSADDGGWARGSAIRAIDQRRSRRPRASPARVIRSMLIGMAVFVLAMLTGALLSGATPAGPVGPIDADPGGSAGSGDPVEADGPARPPRPPGDPAGGEGTGGAGAGPVSSAHSERDLTFAQSMIYTGGAALVVSVVGLIMVGRRRRLW